MEVRIIPFTTILCVLFLKGNPVGCISDIGYYWKDYNGTIPDDAFVAGKTIDGEKAYVGQVLRYLSPETSTGMVPVQIHPKLQVVTTYYGGGVKGYNRNIKILCGKQDNFQWIPTTSDTIDTDLNDKEIVHGGFIYTTYYIGKIIDDAGELKIGSVEPERPERDLYRQRIMYSIANPTYRKERSYHVLTYEPRTKSGTSFETCINGDNYIIKINVPEEVKN